jgi:hypothetical protein
MQVLPSHLHVNAFHVYYIQLPPMCLMCMHDYLRAIDIPKYLGFGLKLLSERRGLSKYIYEKH